MKKPFFFTAIAQFCIILTKEKNHPKCPQLRRDTADYFKNVGDNCCFQFVIFNQSSIKKKITKKPSASKYKNNKKKFKL